MPGPPALELGDGQDWIVFQMGLRGTATMTLIQIGTVHAGSEASAIISAAEAGLIKVSGNYIAIPKSQLVPVRISIRHYVVVE